MTKKTASLFLILTGFLFIVAAGWNMVSSPNATDNTAIIDMLPAGTDTQVSATAAPSETPPASPTIDPVSFDGQRAYADVETQVAFGPRSPGTEGHGQIRTWMQNEIVAAGWQLEVQASEALGHTIYNLIAKNSDEPPQIIIGAHYDSRMFADRDLDVINQTKPVPAANDGASGVAILLGLARSLPKDTVPIWLVFFDAEDNGHITGWDWIMGSREFVKNNPTLKPRAVVIVDMIGDADLNIYKEGNSNAAITDEIWSVAQSLGYEDKFIPEYRHSMLDDHTPFLEAGIPAVDIIDFDYPYYHTLADTPDKVSAESLKVVGDTLWTWITQQSGQN